MMIERGVSVVAAVLGVAFATTVEAAGPAEGINVNVVNPPGQPLPVTFFPEAPFSIPSQDLLWGGA